MAPPKIFLTGATGYIGGDFLALAVQTHPDWDITALVRNSDKGALVTSKYPHVKVVIGSLESAEVLETESKKADIVYHFADCDHEASATAITKGLSAHTPEHPGYLIHTSGTGVLTWEDMRAESFGEHREKEYNDWDGVGEVTSLPDDAFHRVVDKIVLDAGQKYSDRLKTAIVCPPCINGPGRGPGNTNSVQVYRLSRAVLKKKQGLLLGKGQNVWHQVNVQDLSDVYLAIGESAVAGDGKATWGNEGYYFAENGSFAWGDIQKAVTKAAYEKKLISSADPVVVDKKGVEAFDPIGPYAWGTNSRGRAIRARKLFGWNPHRPSLSELVPFIVDVEARALQLA